MLVFRKILHTYKMDAHLERPLLRWQNYVKNYGINEDVKTGC